MKTRERASGSAPRLHRIGRITSVLTLTLLLAGSCGYNMGYQARLPGIRTVHVGVVGNDTFRQRLERDLTRAIAEKLTEYSGYRHASRDRADAILKVTIVGIRNSTVVLGVPIREGSIDGVAEIQLIERRTGRILVEKRLRDIAEYRTMIGEDGTTAQAELVSDLGRRIVLALESDF